MFNIKPFNRSFTLEETYPCPVCRTGHLASLSLMEAFACDVCRHIFTATLEQQVLKMVDREPPLIWHWNGRTWVGAHLQGVEFGWIYGLAAAIFILLPPSIIGITTYRFPPIPGSRLSWLPIIWPWLTLAAHLIIVGWLITEFYQFPFRVYFGVIRRRLLRR